MLFVSLSLALLESTSWIHLKMLGRWPNLARKSLVDAEEGQRHETKRSVNPGHRANSPRMMHLHSYQPTSPRTT